MKITRKWLNLLRLEKGRTNDNRDSENYGEYSVKPGSRGKSFGLLAGIAAISVAAIFFPIGGRFLPQIPFASWAFNEKNSTLGKIARSLLVWPLGIVLGSIALGLAVTAIVGLACCCCCYLTFHLIS